MNKIPLQNFDPEVAGAIRHELARQESGLEMIPSENFVSLAVLEALGSVTTNKYSEGYPGNRYYGGCEYIDIIEQLAIDRAKQLFGAEHVNVQPLSGAPANIAVYLGLMEPGDTILGMDLSHGGHLTHGHPVTYMAKIFNFIRYKTDAEGKIDLDHLRQMAREHRPKVILVGYSAYSRDIDYAAVKQIAEEVGAITIADIAHIAGIIGGMIMCREKFAKILDKAVFPGFQGGPHENVIAAKAVAFKEALQPDFKTYAKQILLNAKTLERKFREYGYRIMFGGTDNHLLLVDVTPQGLTGKEAQLAFDRAGITLNKNMIPDDPRSPMNPSGIRFGTPALTTRGMKEPEMELIAGMMNEVVEHRADDAYLLGVKERVGELTRRFPLYPELAR